MENEIILKEVNGEVTANSREVAERFGKQHKHVLEKIELAIKNFNSAEKSAQYFMLSNYIDSSGKSK
jgi:phage regulator Rha-like protein